ncbi:S-layer homology domain-containing protein [Sporosarcina sp. Te-1]|uniref:S-layer homology domain-containing protein n=1 Tax=Sporosarcina sp. Te-1 TaxID=2818390 RepID=UPI001A9F33F3|nr:S-layer homology domain-containing protein [Sporosarcina sp. Te-1]QTD42918.1 S-layer homology domain-containing protein [Sporosarcina sp. Te-1]
MDKKNSTWSKALKTVAVCAVSLAAISVYSPAHAAEKEVVAVAQQKTSFKDVAKGYWATDSIEWAASTGLIKGFPDGTFKPNDVLTEEQFTTMLTRFYEELGKEVESSTADSKWANQKYEGLAHYKIPLLGYDDVDFRKNPVNRGLIAQVFAYLQNNSSDLEDAVTYLFDKGITNGSNPNGKTPVEKFGATDQLTRAHAVAFFKRIADSGKVSVNPEVIADKIEVNTANAAETLRLAKEEALLKVDPIAIPDKQELKVQKQQLIEKKKEVAKELGVKMEDIGKAIGEAKRAGDYDKVQQLILEKKTVIQDKKDQNKEIGKQISELEKMKNETNGKAEGTNKETGKQLSELGKSIGEAKRNGDEGKAQELIDAKKELAQEKQQQNKEYGKQMSEIGQSIGEAKRNGDEAKAQELINAKKDLAQEKQQQNKEYGKQMSEYGKSIGEAKRAQYGKGN